MGRNNADFFHGSDHPFKPGDVVEPRGYPAVAWASTQPSVAKMYGKKIYHVEPMGDDVKRQPGAGKQYGIHNSATGFRVLGEHTKPVKDLDF